MPLPFIPLPFRLRGRTFCLVLFAALMLLAGLARAQTVASDLLLFEVRMEEHLVAEAMTAYRVDNTLYFPLGELSRLAGIAIQTRPREGTASGFIVEQERRFSLNARRLSYTLGTQTASLQEADLLLRTDDIYISQALLERWLPLDIEVELSRLLLRLHPTETLPLQARQQREQRAAQLKRRRGEPSPHARHPLPYRLIDVPFIDQTFSLDARNNNRNSDRNSGQKNELDGSYTLFATGDLLGMEGSLYFTHRSDQDSPDPRLTLSRHDPDARLLGPLQARSLELGSIVVPGITHVSQTSTPGYGFRISNRPLTHPLNFNLHSLQGDLPPGWDVELYFNEALVGLQRADAQGRYRFDDLPLIFGVNEFRLVFYGPLGQVRVERQRILLEPSIVRPGEFFYSLADQHDEFGGRRSSLQFDAGLGQSLVAVGGIATLPYGGEEKNYANLGLRRFGRHFIVSGEFATSDDGGSLGELGLRTRIGNMGLQISRAQLNDFISELYASSGDPIRSRDLLRLDGSLAALPRLSLALEARQDRLQSGHRQRDASLRLSSTVRNTALSHTLRWLKSGQASETHGFFQFSRRVADIGITGQLNYRIHPRAEMRDALLTADKPLRQGYRMNVAVARLHEERDLRYTLGLTKSLGRFGLRLNASHSREGESALGLQLFIAASRNPRQGTWHTDAQPVAHTGAAAMQVFLDRNQNGVRDGDEQAISQAGFRVRGNPHPVRTDEEGYALLGNLPVRRHVDVELELSSLPDPQWMAQKPGLQLLARPGRVAEIDVPVVLSTEITGKVFLHQRRQRRGIGDAIVELVDARGEIVAETRSAADGVYVISNVAAGDYVLRISPAQAQRLRLDATPARSMKVTGESYLIEQQDFELSVAE